jgi:very-short-patch-repair endonuclease
MRESTERARELRRNSTRAEVLMWAQLRDRRLCGFKFRRQRPVGRYYADFACVERRLIVELDGEPHDWTFDYDSARERRLGRDGFRVVRFRNEDVVRNLQGVLDAIIEALKDEQRASHTPSP